MARYEREGDWRKIRPYRSYPSKRIPGREVKFDRYVQEAVVAQQVAGDRPDLHVAITRGSNDISEDPNTHAKKMTTTIIAQATPPDADTKPFWAEVDTRLADIRRGRE